MGYVIGEFVRMVIIFIVIKYKKLFKLRFLIKLDSRLFEFLKKALLQVFSMMALNINSFIDKTMASWLSEGSVSVLYYAERLYMVPVTFLINGLMVTLLSHWSSRYYSQPIVQLN